MTPSLASAKGAIATLTCNMCCGTALSLGQNSRRQHTLRQQRSSFRGPACGSGVSLLYAIRPCRFRHMSLKAFMLKACGRLSRSLMVMLTCLHLMLQEARAVRMIGLGVCRGPSLHTLCRMRGPRVSPAFLVLHMSFLCRLRNKGPSLSFLAGFRVTLTLRWTVRVPSKS